MVNNKRKIKNLKKLKLLFLAGVMSSSLKTNVNAKELDFVVNNDAKYHTEVENQIRKLPHNLCQYIKDIGVKVVLLADEDGAENAWEDIYGDYPGHIRGFTYVEENTIYVEATDHSGYYEKYSDCSEGLSADEFNSRLSIDTVTHELGHIIDSEADFELSSSSEFIDIFYDEVESFKKTDEYNIENLKINANINTAVEYWATAFTCYVKYPDSLLKYCPKTYDYIKSYLLTIEEKYPNNEYEEKTSNDSKKDNENIYIFKEKLLNKRYNLK